MRLKLAVLFFYLGGICISQNFTTRLFSKDQGLPDAYIYNILQDKEGFLWIATGKGLVKYDGQFFSRINKIIETEDIIYSGAKTKNNELWFGTFSGKIYSYDRGSKTLKLFPEKISGSINKILPSAFSNDLFILSKGRGIFLKEKNDLTQVPQSENYQVNAIEELDRDNLLACTSEGLFIVNLKSRSIGKLSGLEGEITGIQKLKRKKNTFLLSSVHEGIIEVEINEHSTLRMTKKMGEAERFPLKEIVTFCFNEEDLNLYVATADERLSIINTVTHKIKTLGEAEFSARAVSFFMDRESDVWVATAGKGLYRLVKTDYDVLDTEHEPVFAITQDNTGNTYYGTKNGITVHNAKGESGKTISKIGNRTLGKINALYFDNTHLWIGTESNGLFIIDPVTFKGKSIEFSGIENISINAITGKDNEVSVTTNLDGVYNYNTYELKNHFSVTNSLLHNNVYSSFLSKNRKIYYATHNTSFNYSEGNQLYEIDTKALGFISDFNSFAEDSGGRLMIATNGEGVYILKDTTIQPFEFNDQLDSKFCQGLLYDKENNLWIIQRYNVYKYNTAQKVLTKVKFAQNEQELFHPQAYYLSNKGDVYLGTNKNVIVFNAKHKPDKLPQAYLMVEHIQDSTIKMKNGMSLPGGTYNFTFEISAIGLKNSEGIRFKYKLEGRDNSWSELSTTRKVEFPKLGEGNYFFKVIAYNSEGFSGQETVLFHFTISEPLWKKPAFWIIFVILLILLVFLIVRIRTSALIKAKNKLEEIVTEKTKELREEKELVEQSNKRIEEQNQEIKDSITYAKRIQDALLPDKELLLSKDKNIFVLYQPRDIVSGDFYWIAEINGLKIIVSADCTGHGVPGALMSMVGTTLLNKIILERKITRPKKILKELDKEIKQALKQHTTNATRDGMDMCLCSIDPANKKLVYSGAMRPLFFVRDRQLTEYSPTKHAIGGYSYGKDKEFQETEIETKENDMFYLFSDGYADQFGGEKGKKLMIKNFKKLLISVSEMELSKQEENLYRVYNSWKGTLDQVDDVLVIGLKI